MDRIKWLLEGDVSIQYQVHRDLLDDDNESLRNRITYEGWGKQLLDLQQDNGHWGGGYYHYKWISTHYTLMELRRLNIKPNPSILRICNIIADDYKTNDGGITPNPQHWEFSDVCINGMSLYFMCYFGIAEEKLKSVIDFIISQQLPDGGFNCNYNYEKYGARHSSLHSTVSMVEGFNSFLQNGYNYKKDDVIRMREEAIEFMLMHRLFKSDHTGEVIKKQFTMLSYPPRWKYDILRALDAMREAGITYDERMADAFVILEKKQRKDGTWPLQNKHSGKVHFDMEKPGSSSRWNTLRVLRVYKHFLPHKTI
ncbi:prenyltransferase/squalene oxidase repeat-containing protein [Candidatus Xianfuyuplasma coldseepsis]|uniref:Squalene cyclase C-terminal domain-containing protein n=1 Tax=Candidatus Xianfuyuplasma coldseepsis TaxID=2782163 RepID=A0A7L7KS87_9MOLU|nr:prenyltransferase/squalene oxidase repeat-containing protein [Xianfuyuplasma coldseepsis]QMS85465.1 hypothetical protein G4Z02_06810 [Xianfuyuplasma coldseepsis]